ncbi:helix-turn-helix transcriptional regulator [Halobellus ordinarius]|uniref:helix-turn-helix transcriptional regulator n=1 Tax=Halobellus ordinarius TaxID=3075120 RepID=UPI0028804B1B|nr:hypothetical protein [Halobellus sp. ZY16]
MSGNDGPLEKVRFLAGATSRVRVMEYLAGLGPADQPELRANVAGSRTTISRALRSLEDEGWVATEDNTYRLTHTGSVIADEFADLLATIRRTEELSEFLRWFPTDSDAPDFLRARDVDVTASTDANPYAPAKQQAAILNTAEELRILLPSVDPDSTETLTEQVTNRGLRVETVISPELEPVFESDELAPLIAEMVDTERSDILVSSDPLPFYLGLADDGLVQIGVEDDEGFPRALLETTDGDVRAWAEDTYRTYRENARDKPFAEF